LELKEQQELSLIISGCLKKEPKSQALLYRKFYGYAMAICLRYTSQEEEAVEVLNDGFLKVFSKINQHQQIDTFKGWIRKIMINTAIDYYRKNKKVKFQELNEVPDNQFVNSDILEYLSAEEIIHYIQTLPPVYRVVFNLYVLEGYSHKEISEKLSITESTSRSHLSVANSKLRVILEKKDNERKIIRT
jgi:RNA polymerase sigma-70 factor (ECF subfamily)